MDNKEKERRAKLIIEQSEGIFPVFEVFYLESIIDTARRALHAFESFDDAFKAGISDEIVVALIQEALTHSASLSRFFWPSRDKGVTFSRGAKLRKHFSVPDNSPLKDKSLRNALEHYDERLDDFLLEDHAGTFYPQSIIGPASFSDEQVTYIFRLVDPETKIFILLGKKYHFGPVREAVKQIFEQATGMNNNGGRLR